MPSLLAFLPLAMDVPDGAVWAVALSIGASVVAAVKIVWAYWTKTIDTKDAVIASKDATISTLQADKVHQAEEHAKVTERLMQMAMGKVEDWSEKDRVLLERALTVMGEFKDEVRKLNTGSDIGPVRVPGFPTPIPPSARGGRE